MFYDTIPWHDGDSGKRMLVGQKLEDGIIKQNEDGYQKAFFLGEG